MRARYTMQELPFLANFPVVGEAILLAFRDFLADFVENRERRERGNTCRNFHFWPIFPKVGNKSLKLIGDFFGSFFEISSFFGEKRVATIWG